MDSRGRPHDGMPRRTFLAAALVGASSIVLAGCTPGPAPTRSPTPTAAPTTTPTDLPAPGPDGLPRLTAFRRSRWGADPFARGAFSFDEVGSTPRLRDALARPVGDRVWFAGEACSTEAPGTMDGAVASGRAAAASLAARAGDGERIVIVGAGLAGLTAANDLLRRGFRVVVVEARDRAGGRIDSVEDDAFGGWAQLGAFLVGDDAEAMDELLDEASVSTTPLAPPETALAPDSAWVPVDPIGATSIETAREWALAQPSDVSLAAALVGSGATAALPSTPDEHGVRASDWLARTIASGVEVGTGATSTEVSATGARSSALGGGQRVIRGDLGEVIDRLTAEVDIAVSSPVTRVAWTDQRVSLRLETGESITADRAIVTAPLGVLKTSTITFSPRLPLGHQRAISLLGMGLVDTVWLRFEEPFWRSGASGPDGADATPDVLTVVGSTPSVAAWIDVGRADDEPVLVGVIAAAQATRLEKLDDAAFQAEVLGALAPFATASG